MLNVFVNGGTFTLGTAIGLNMNASFYTDSVNVAVCKETVEFMESEYGSRAKQVLAILDCFL